jgi:CO/xanthine dehydrogenase Mo-binding subunit
MRAPGEASGMMALEVAMDELAEKLGMDPVELRILNDTQTVPDAPGRGGQTDPQAASQQGSKDVPGRPFSTRQLVKCLRTGAERFGWRERNPKPGARRDGHWLIGMGMASAIRGAPIMPAGARVTLGADGVITVESNMTDMGTGSYTVIGQTAAEMMGVSLDRVVVKLADTRFPEAFGGGGQAGAATATAGVYAACAKLRDEVQGPVRPSQRGSGQGGRVRANHGRGQDRVRRPVQPVRAADLRRPLLRGRGRRLHRRDPHPPDAGGLPRRSDPQSADGAQPGDWRHDHGRRRGADGGAGGRQGAGFLRQS